MGADHDDFGSRHDVLRHAREQAIAHAQSNALADRMAAADAPARDTEEAVRTWVRLGKAMLAGGRITGSEALFYLTFAVEGWHTRRWLDGAYPEVQALSGEMAAVERDHGLTRGQYWTKDQAPTSYRALSDDYDAALDARFEEALRAFDLNPLADLWHEDRAEYDQLREIGRRSVFEKDASARAIDSVIPLYEDEARRSAAAGAFYAAAVMLGSAAEARLLDRLLRSQSETAAARAGLPRAARPSNADPLHWSLEHMLAVAERADWIGIVEDEEVGADVKAWLMSVRDLRNLLHAGRHVRDKPHVTIGEAEYTDAKFGYAALCIALAQSAANGVLDRSATLGGEGDCACGSGPAAF